MNTAVALMSFCFLALAFSAESVSTERPVTTHTEDLCDGRRIEDLAACGCFVSAAFPDAPEEELEVCQKLFGEDLLTLKPHCKEYMNGDEVDTDAVTDAIAEVKKECMSELLSSLGSRRITQRQSLEHVTGRWVPLLVAAVILLYPSEAH